MINVKSAIFTSIEKWAYFFKITWYLKSGNFLRCTGHFKVRFKVFECWKQTSRTKNVVSRPPNHKVHSVRAVIFLFWSEMEQSELRESQATKYISVCNDDCPNNASWLAENQILAIRLVSTYSLYAGHSRTFFIFPMKFASFNFEKMSILCGDNEFPRDHTYHFSVPKFCWKPCRSILSTTLESRKQDRSWRWKRQAKFAGRFEEALEEPHRATNKDWTSLAINLENLNASQMEENESKASQTDELQQTSMKHDMRKIKATYLSWRNAYHWKCLRI